jgi:hypothetical protein
MIVYQSRFLTRGEVWFDDQPARPGVDWLLYNQCPQAVPGSKSKYFHSYIVDLVGSPDDLFGAISSETAYKIRRARDKDHVTCEFSEKGDPAVLDAFEAMHNRFAIGKGLSPMDRRRLNSLAAAGVLVLTIAKDVEGNPLVYHAHYRGENRITLLFSVSCFRDLASSAARNAIGRANRFLTWTEMLRSKEQGLKYFDFGGWYPGTADQSLLQINAFKKGFGGRVVREYECERILTLRGRVVLAIAALLKRKRETANSEAPTGQDGRTTGGEAAGGEMEMAAAPGGQSQR